MRRTIRRAVVRTGRVALRRRGSSPPSGPTPIGIVDTPTGTELWRAVPTTFTGWAVWGEEPVDAVDVVVGDAAPIAAALRRPREDIPIHLANPAVTSLSGWTAEVDLAQCTSQAVRIQVIATAGRDNRTVLMDRTFEVRADEFAGQIQAPTEGSLIHDDLLKVRGWAVVGGAAAARVDVTVNGAWAGRARVRVPNHEVPSRLPARVGAFSGFDFRLPMEQVAGTVATIDVELTGMDGQTVTMPRRTVQLERPRVTAGAEERGAMLRSRAQYASRSYRRTPVPTPGRRLLIFTHELGLGGGQLYLLELLRQLAPRLDGCVVVSPIDGLLRADIENLGVEVVISGRGLPRDVEGYEGQVRELMAFIAGETPDVVLLNTLGTWPAGDAAQRLEIPTLWAIHESYTLAEWLQAAYGGPLYEPYIAARLEATLARATRLIFEAQATSTLFADWADAEHRLLVPYGVEIDAIDAHAAALDPVALRAAEGIADDAVVLLTVGLYEERKSQASIVEAFATVAAEHPQALLALVGEAPSTYSRALRGVVNALGMDGRILLIPATPAIWDWYALSDVLVSASDVESLPRSMLEAMAFAKPVLSTNVFGIPELIEDGANGWLCEPRDVGQLAAGIRRVLTAGDAARARAGLAAQARVRERHRSSNYGDAYSDLIDSVQGEQVDPQGVRAGSAGAVTEAIDSALSAFAGAVPRHRHRAHHSATPSAPSPGLDAFNHLAPYVRDGIGRFVEEAARRTAAGARVIDVGAGDAPYRGLFDHTDYVTVDWANSVHPGASQSDIIASVESLPLEDESADLVIMTEVLEHIAVPPAALREVARILRPGGEIIVTVPFVWMLHEMPFDFYRYTPPALRHLLESAGFEEVEVAARGDYFSTLAQLMQMVQHWISLDPVDDGLADRRHLAGRVLADLSADMAALGPLDTQALLPLGFNVSGRRRQPASGS